MNRLASIIISALIIIPFSILAYQIVIKEDHQNEHIAKKEMPQKILTEREKLEKSFIGQQLKLISLKFPLADTFIAKNVEMSIGDFEERSFYLKDPNSQDYIYLSKDKVQSSIELPAKVIKQKLDLLFQDNALHIFIDDKALNRNLHNWQYFWLSQKASKPLLNIKDYKYLSMQDSFMRTSIIKDSPWQITSGKWQLHKHGNGMPENESQLASASFERAVNPFTVFGENGILSYGNEDWFNAKAQASFYFGLPRIGAVNTWDLPPQDMMIIQGDINQYQVAFGWSGTEKTFVLQERQNSTESWTVIKKWQGKRPPISNWVKLALRIKDGFKAEAWLDDNRIFQYPLKQRIDGTFHILSANQTIELDDVKCSNRPQTKNEMQPLFIKSQNFSGKNLSSKADPKEYSKWARGSDTMIHKMIKGTDYDRALAINRLPLIGDFVYKTIEHTDVAGDLPYGLYEVIIYQDKQMKSFDLDKLDELKRIHFTHDETGWIGLQGLSLSEPIKNLEIRRTDDNIELVSNQGTVQLLKNSSALHFGIARLLPMGSNTESKYPLAEHHMFYLKNLHHELFEQAAVDWNWIEGGFRMDCRWACKEEFNFMACGGKGVPMMVSKKQFKGNQIHDFFMSLRPHFPSDAGDRNYHYDRKKLGTQSSNYLTHNLNFSFCFDGKNPLSGYSVIFGSDSSPGSYKNKSRKRALNLLIKEGEVVATNTTINFAHKDRNIHHKWWNFSVQRKGNLILVYLNEDLLFEYYDETPLKGGHIGFWTVRNCFTIAKVTSLADSYTSENFHYYVENDDKESPWKALMKDSVTIKQRADNSLVKFNTGAGFQAIRYTPKKTIDLQQNPILNLSLIKEQNIRINIYDDIDGKTFMIPIDAPIGYTKELLGKAFETSVPKNIFDLNSTDRKIAIKQADHFSVKFIKESKMNHYLLNASYIKGEFQNNNKLENNVLRIDLLNAVKTTIARYDKNYSGPYHLTSITVGNSSNKNYLLVGSNGHNNADSSYIISKPVFSKALKTQ